MGPTSRNMKSANLISQKIKLVPGKLVNNFSKIRRRSSSLRQQRKISQTKSQCPSISSSSSKSTTQSDKQNC